MKTLVLWFYLGIFLATSAVVTVHVKSMNDVQGHVTRVQPLYQRMAVFPEIRLSMEKYRRASGNFRKMYNAEIASSKTKFHNEIAQDLAHLNELDSSEEDQPLVKSIQDGVDELLRLSAKYEPQLFLKDAYQKPDVQELHEQILKTVSDLESASQHRLDNEVASTGKDGDRALRLILAAELAVLVLVALMIARTYVTLIRPSRRLAKYARDVANNRGKIEPPAGLPGKQAEVARILADLADQAEQLREQRRKFIEDVIEDVRPGLAALKRSHDVEGAQEILAASLDDLKQLAEISRIDQRLNHGVVDLSELLSDTCKRATRAGLCPEIRVSVPALPTWVRVDIQKTERAVIQILARLGEMLEKGQTLEASIQVKGRPGLNGIEILFNSSGARIPGAPEQELGRHWISSRGLALTLAQKVIKAHGGMIFASGLIGSPVQVSMRYPKTILTDGLVSPGKRDTSQPLVDVDNLNSV